jgi:hypothetical protein
VVHTNQEIIFRETFQPGVETRRAFHKGMKKGMKFAGERYTFDAQVRGADAVAPAK